MDIWNSTSSRLSWLFLFDTQTALHYGLGMRMRTGGLGMRLGYLGMRMRTGGLGMRLGDLA